MDRSGSVPTPRSSPSATAFPLNAFDRWLEETDRAVAEAHVLFVHTKYMLIDPLGPGPDGGRRVGQFLQGLHGHPMTRTCW